MYEDDLQLGKLKENCLLLKLYSKLMFASHSHTYIFVNKIYWHIETAV